MVHYQHFIYTGSHKKIHQVSCKNLGMFINLAKVQIKIKFHLTIQKEIAPFLMLMENTWGITKKLQVTEKLIFMEFMDRSKCNDLRYTDNKKILLV